jgi:hypothetical protein
MKYGSTDIKYNKQSSFILLLQFLIRESTIFISELLKVKEFYAPINNTLPVPGAARSKAWFCGCSLVGIAGSNPAFMDACCECCVLSGRGLCVGLITRPEEYYRVWCVIMCDREDSTLRRPVHWGLSCYARDGGGGSKWCNRDRSAGLVPKGWVGCPRSSSLSPGRGRRLVSSLKFKN